MAASAPARGVHGHGRRIAASLLVAQGQPALAVMDRLLRAAGIEAADLEHVEDLQVFAMLREILARLRDRLLIALHVGERNDNVPAQTRQVRPGCDQFLGEDAGGLPVAALEESVEQQFLGVEIGRIDHGDRAQPDDRLLVLAGAQQRADVCMRHGSGIGKRAGGRRRHAPPGAISSADPAGYAVP